MMPVLIALSVGVGVVAVAGLLSRRIAMHHCVGLIAIDQFLVSFQMVCDGDDFSACLATAVSAFAAHVWWRGGGDDTKRRLRKIRRAFGGVRRTAPTTA